MRHSLSFSASIVPATALLATLSLLPTSASAQASCPCTFEGPSYDESEILCSSDKFTSFVPNQFQGSVQMYLTERHPKNGREDIWVFQTFATLARSCTVNHTIRSKNGRDRTVKNDQEIVSDLTEGEYNACLNELRTLARGPGQTGTVLPLRDSNLDGFDAVDGFLDECRETSPGVFEICENRTDPDCFACTVSHNSCDPQNALTNVGLQVTGDRMYDFPAAQEYYGTPSQ